MSNDSGMTESSNARAGGVVAGVPRRCWCGQKTELKLSKSQNNPHRRFFKCSYAAAKRLEDDNHVFKWMDEAILSEIEIYESKMQSLRREIITSRIEIEKMQRDFETEILQRVEDVFKEAKSGAKKMIVFVIVVFVVGCISMKALSQ